MALRNRPLILGGLFICLVAFPRSEAQPSTTEVRIPLLDDGAFLRVPISLSGRILYFIVDTGASRSSIDTHYTNIPAMPIGSADQETSADNVSANVIKSPALTIGAVPLGFENILDNDLSLAREVTGEECDGILGLDALRRYVVSIDFDGGEIVLRQSSDGKPLAGAEAIHLRMADSLYSLPSRINGSREMDLLIDSGANTSISLNPNAWHEALNDSDRTRGVPALFGTVGRQVTQSRMVRVHELQIGHHEYNDLICILVGQSAESSIGLPFLRRHQVTFDFPTQTLYLVPRHFSSPDKRDMSGLHLLKIGPNVTVHSVDPQSPAEACGIVSGDVLSRVDDADVPALSMKILRELFMTKDGDKRALVIQRGKHEMTVYLVLKNEL
jgi:predicted aspartyl protease